MDPYKNIRRCIWLYMILIIVEGAVRKWGPGSMNYPFLIIRDPLLLAIYVMAFAKHVFPGNFYVILIFSLTMITGFFTMATGHGDLRVMVYGIHYNFFHFPLIWVMANVLRRSDVWAMGSALLILAVPNTLLMIAQFNAPPDAYINKGVGDGLGGQLDGGMGKIRPPGLFSFITGNNMYYPIVAAFLFAQFTEKRTLWWWLLLPIGGLVALAQVISLSRAMMLATVIVAMAAVFCLLRKGVLSGKFVLLILSAPIVAYALFNFVPVFHDGMTVFTDRWERSTDNRGGVQSAIFDRFLGGLTNAIIYSSHTSIFGEGIGMGSNVGARFLTGEFAFLLAEEEWSRAVLEMGPLFGFIYLGLRFAMAFSLLNVAVRRFFRAGDTLPGLLASAAFLPLLQGQIAPPTMLGFTVFGAGLVLAACNDPESEEELEEEDDDEEIDEIEDDEELPSRYTDAEDRYPAGRRPAEDGVE